MLIYFIKALQNPQLYQFPGNTLTDPNQNLYFHHYFSLVVQESNHFVASSNVDRNEFGLDLSVYYFCLLVSPLLHQYCQFVLFDQLI